jgi:hypothetical protein
LPWAPPPRSSTATGKNYSVRHPVNALPNYAQAVLKSTTRAAIVTEGLDPAIGYLHAHPSRSDRDSGARALVLDLMEPLRPCAGVLAVISGHAFAPHDPHVTTQSAYRLNPQLARYVAAKVLGSELPGPQSSSNGRRRRQAKSGSDIFSYLDQDPAHAAKAGNVHEAARIVVKAAIREIAKEPARRRRT